jgi:nickel/cobalt transporter (NiCoT) family protein
MSFSMVERGRLLAFFTVIGLLHVVGWGAYLYYSSAFPQLVGLGFVAYLMGLRHAFDADHIAAVDDTTRYLLQKKERSLGAGFFFALGHSSVVLVVSLALATGATAIKSHLPAFENLGGLIGAAVSGLFLWIVGILNLLVLLDILNIWRSTKIGGHSHAHIEELLHKRGLLNRLCGGRLQRLIQHSWQMYPLGILFGLGFDTASEVGFLGMTAGASAGNLPIVALVCLPVLFAAGMTLMDTTDGVLMCKAYDWAYLNPLRKVFYNVVITAISVLVAFILGTVELLQVLIGSLSLRGGVSDLISKMDFGIWGYGIVGLFLVAWGVSVALWRFRRYVERNQRISSSPGWQSLPGVGKTK